MSGHVNFPTGGAFAPELDGVRDYIGHVMATFNSKCIGCGSPRSLHYQGEVCGGFAAVMAAKGEKLPWFSDYSGPLERP